MTMMTIFGSIILGLMVIKDAHAQDVSVTPQVVKVAENVRIVPTACSTMANLKADFIEYAPTIVTTYFNQMPAAEVQVWQDLNSITVTSLSDWMNYVNQYPGAIAQKYNTMSTATLNAIKKSKPKGATTAMNSFATATMTQVGNIARFGQQNNATAINAMLTSVTTQYDALTVKDFVSAKKAMPKLHKLGKDPNYLAIKKCLAIATA